MKTPDIKTWDEFKWEKMLKEEDRRINVYLRTLPSLIDLPRENEMISKTISTRHPEITDPHLCRSPLFDDLEFDENSFQVTKSDWEFRKESELYRIVYELSREWSALFASRLFNGHSEPALAILCFYGMILLRMMFIMDAPQEYRGLIVAHTKRILAGINSISDLMKQILGKNPEESARIGKQIAGLASLRGKIFEFSVRVKEENQ